MAGAPARSPPRSRAASLAELSQMAEDARDWDDALAHARELLALEPLSEAAHRRLMRLHYLAGDRVAALLAFDRCEQVLKDEVGRGRRPRRWRCWRRSSAAQLQAAPTVAQARAGQRAAPAAHDRPRRELAHLHARLAGRAGGGADRRGWHRQDAPVAGVCPAAQSGVVQAAGRPGDAGVPFATLARLLRAVMAQAGTTSGQDARLPPGTRTEIARVLPEFDGPATRHTGEGQRLVLQRAVRSLLAAAARSDRADASTTCTSPTRPAWRCCAR